MHRTRALAAGFALALALAAPVAAATTADVAETLSVNSTLAVVLSKSAIDYGAIDPGGTTAAATADRTVNAQVSGNVDWTLAITGSAFTRTGGGTMPASARQMKVLPAGSWAVLPQSANGTAGVAYSGNFEFSVTVPAGTQSGSYTGTITFTVTGT